MPKTTRVILSCRRWNGATNAGIERDGTFLPGFSVKAADDATVRALFARAVEQFGNVEISESCAHCFPDHVASPPGRPCPPAEAECATESATVDEAYWKALLAELTISGTVAPVGNELLDRYEAAHHVPLPDSYRSFCRVFGPGVVSEWFSIAVPYCDCRSQEFDLVEQFYGVKSNTDWETIVVDTEQFRRSILFASDETAAFYFWDPEEITDSAKHEYAVYAMFRDWSSQRLCGTFWEFIDVCLCRHATRIYDPGPPTFRAALPKRRRRKAE